MAPKLSEAPRAAVLFRTYFWDEYAFRAAVRVWDRSVGTDFYVEANETDCGELDVGPFRKLDYTVGHFEAMGLPCVARGKAPPLWWNCDYGLYEAATRLPDYDYYFHIEADVAVNVELRALVEQVAAARLDCVNLSGNMPVTPRWGFAESCADLPYRAKSWTPLSVMLVSRPAALRLMAERLRLARLYADKQIAEWPISEGFLASALADAGYASAPLQKFVKLPHFGTEALFLETDPRTRMPGSLSHSVLDAERVWEKFSGRVFWNLLTRGDYAQLRDIRDSLMSVGQRRHRGFRINSDAANLALDRPARQSSVSTWSRKARLGGGDPNEIDARGANRGVLTGQYCFHTDHEIQPWWAVDLERRCVVEQVRIYNGFPVPERARHLKVEVSSDGREWLEVFRKSDDRVFAGNDDPLICDLSQPAPAAHVRVVVDGPGFLHLDEVEVYGSAVPA